MQPALLYEQTALQLPAFRSSHFLILLSGSGARSTKLWDVTPDRKQPTSSPPGWTYPSCRLAWPPYRDSPAPRTISTITPTEAHVWAFIVTRSKSAWLVRLFASRLLIRLVSLLGPGFYTSRQDDEIASKVGYELFNIRILSKAI